VAAKKKAREEKGGEKEGTFIKSKQMMFGNDKKLAPSDFSDNPVYQQQKQMLMRGIQPGNAQVLGHLHKDYSAYDG